MSSTITKFFASFLAYGVANKKKRFSAIGRFSEGLAPVKGKIQWGYINKEYDVVIPLMYERAFSFKEGLGMVVLILNTDSSTIPDKYGFRLNTQPLTRLSKNVHEYVTMDYGD